MANHFRRCRGVALPVMMLCAAGSAAAGDSGFYLGLDSGVVKWSVRFGWTDYFHVGSTDKIKGITVDGPNINTFTLGVAYRF